VADASDGPADVDDTGGGGGVSFDELKAEYDESEGWDEPAGDEAVSEPAAADGVPGDLDDDTETTLDATEEDTSDDVTEADEGDGPDVAQSDEADSDSGETNDDVAVDVDVSADADEVAETADGDGADPDEPVDADGDTDEAESAASETHREVSVDSVEVVTDDEMFLADDETARAEEGRTSTTPDTDDGVGRERLGAERAAASGPYLTSLPTTYVAESVAMEWMQYLVSSGGPLGASRALRLYEDFGWISPEVRSTLDAYARSVASPRDDAQNGSLTAKHHETSLSYVSRLGDRTPESGALDALVADGGSHDGIRR
jgi:archaellum component FlaD/FlaE